MKILNLDEVMLQLNEYTSTLISNIGKEMYLQVTARTPVETGRAKANWYCSVNSINTTTSDSVIFDSSRAEKAFASVSVGDILNICNSTPYICYLEQGWSDQAPNGMAGPTVSDCAGKLERGEFL